MATFHEVETDDATEAQLEGTPPGVRLAIQLICGLLLVLCVPYGLRATVGDSPWVDRLTPWIPGVDETPFSNLFRTDTAGPVVAEAGGNAMSAAMDHLEEEADAAEPISLLVVEEAPTLAEGAAEPSQVESPAEVTPMPPPVPRLRVPPALYEGTQVFIEDPGTAMTPFYEALARTARGTDGAVTRIAHWGDSAIAADGLTHATRRKLQKQFGDSGHGFVLVESGSDWYKHKGVKASRRGFKAAKVINKSLRDGHYGYGGSSARGYQGAWARFGTVDEGDVGTHVDRFDILYAQAPRHGALTITVDGEEREVLETAADALTDAIHTVEVPDGAHEMKLRVRGGGPVRLYGVALERNVPGVVYDTLGVVGARGSRLLNPDPEHWKRQLAFRRPDLMILMFGGNDLDDQKISMTRYEETFTRLARRFRESRPEASCLVISPLDHGERYRGRVRTVPRLIPLIEVQRRVAHAEGCAFFSAMDAMGGEGSMGRWVKEGLGWGDMAHLTRKGGVAMGNLLFKALMKGFGDYLEQR